MEEVGLKGWGTTGVKMSRTGLTVSSEIQRDDCEGVCLCSRMLFCPAN